MHSLSVSEVVIRWQKFSQLVNTALMTSHSLTTPYNRFTLRWHTHYCNYRTVVHRWQWRTTLTNTLPIQPWLMNQITKINKERWKLVWNILSDSDNVSMQCYFSDSDWNKNLNYNYSLLSHYWNKVHHYSSPNNTMSECQLESKADIFEANLRKISYLRKIIGKHSPTH